MKKIFNYFGLILLSLQMLLTGCGSIENPQMTDSFFEENPVIMDSIAEYGPDAEGNEAVTKPEITIESTSDNSELKEPDKDAFYTSREDVALYLYTYGELPVNFITKKEAKALGWEGGYLDDFAEGHCIGGDKFGNYEGLLPQADGRQYYECDIDTMNQSSRGPKRIVFSNDGLIYYTSDHYESFELLYDNAGELKP